MPILLGLATLSACDPVCRGPACEDRWPLGRISIVTPGAQQVDPLVDADAIIAGASSDGSAFVVADRIPVPPALPFPGQTFEPEPLHIGTPESDAVLQLDVRAGEYDMATAVLARWDGIQGEAFGTSAAWLGADRDKGMWVGAPHYNQRAGAVYGLPGNLTHSHRDGLPADSLRLVGEGAGDMLGARMRVCRDVTGDGIEDLLVAAPNAREVAGQAIPSLAGVVYLIRSELVAGLTGEIPITEVSSAWWGDTPGAAAGQSFQCHADITGDGTADLLIGSPYFQPLADQTPTEADVGKPTGRVYLLNTAEGIPPSGRLSDAATRALPAPQSARWFGFALTTINLPRGVGLAIGSPGDRNGEGTVYLYAGNAVTFDGPPPINGFIQPSDRGTPDHFGRWLSTGEVDGDFLPDLLVGAPDWRIRDGGTVSFDVGRAWVFLGEDRSEWSRIGLLEDADTVIAGDQPFQRIGRQIATRDLDGDGTEEVLLPSRAPR